MMKTFNVGASADTHCKKSPQNKHHTTGCLPKKPVDYHQRWFQAPIAMKNSPSGVFFSSVCVSILSLNWPAVRKLHPLLPGEEAEDGDVLPSCGDVCTSSDQQTVNLPTPPAWVRGWLHPSIQTCGRWNKASVNLLNAANRGLKNGELHSSKTTWVFYISNFAFEETVLLRHNAVYDVFLN